MPVVTRGRAALESEAVAFPQLPHEIVTQYIFAALPVDTLLRCAEVSRGWQATSSQRALWRRVNLSHTSGVAKPSLALLRAVLTKARGVLEELDVRVLPFGDWLWPIEESGAVLAGNIDGVALHVTAHVPVQVDPILRSFKPLRELHTANTVFLSGDVNYLDVLHNRGIYAPLRLHSLNVCYCKNDRPENAEDDTPLLLKTLGDAAVHPWLKRLRVIDFDLKSIPSRLNAFLDLAIARPCLRVLDLVCLPPVRFAHDLARVVRDGALTELYIGGSGRFQRCAPRDQQLNTDFETVLDERSAATLASALRGNRTLTALGLRRGVGLWSAPPAATTALLDAITRHPTLCILDLSYDSAEHHQAAAGAAIAALLAANAPALTSLDLSGCYLGEIGMELICDALQRNTHLRELKLYSKNLISKRFARERLIPAADAAKWELKDPLNIWMDLRSNDGRSVPTAEEAAGDAADNEHVEPVEESCSIQ